MKARQLKKIKDTDLILSGGGCKGIFQLGVLHSFYLENMKFKRIFGNSVGALNAVGYGSGKLPKIHLLWEGITSGKPFFTKGIFDLGWIVRGLLGGDGVFNNSKLMKMVEETFDLYDDFEYGQVFFDTVDIRSGKLLHITVEEQSIQIIDEDLNIGDVVYPNPKTFWHKAIVASTSIPVIFRPINLTVDIESIAWDDEFGANVQLVDGGVRNIAPTTLPIKLGSKKMIIVLTAPLGVKPAKDKKYNDAFSIGARSLELTMNEVYQRDIEMMDYINRNQEKGKKWIDYSVIAPDWLLSDSLSPSKEDMEALFDHGVEKGKQFIQNYK